MVSNHKGDLRRVYTHLKFLGLGQISNLIHRDIARWIHHNGPEWTVKRLKDFKQSFIQYLAGSRITWETWVDHHGNGLPKRHWKSLFLLGKKHPKRTQRVLSALMCYTAFTSPRLTEDQLSKARSSIYQIDVPNDTDIINRYLDLINPRDLQMWGRSMKLYYKERFSFAGLNTSKITLSSSGVMQKNRPHQWVHSLTDYLRINNPFDPILKRMGLNGVGPKFSSYRDYPSGKIGVIQERGYKARVVAMPNAAAQVAFHPLHVALDKVLRSLYEDCTHDQEKGAEWASRQLAAGKTLHAIDLSSATDNFPFSYQVNLLDKILPEEFEDVGLYLYRFVKYSSWVGPDGDHWVYTRGQPMGLYSSFPLFALSHHALVRSLSKKKTGGLPYRILGDDIIIADDELADSYRKALQDMSVPVSDHKCVTSSSITEFAGYMITSSGYYKPLKVPKQTSNLDDSFLEYLKVMGPKYLVLLPSRVRRIARLVALIPKELGGLGWNPNGIPSRERWAWALGLLDSEDWIIPDLRDLAPHLIHAKSVYPTWTETGEVLQFLSDQLRLIKQRVYEDLETHLRMIPGNSRSLLHQVRTANGDAVPGFTYEGIVSDVRNNRWRSSKLEQWEAKLGRLTNPAF